MDILDQRGLRQQPEQERSESDQTKVNYRLRLFVADQEPNSLIAEGNIREICMTDLNGNFELKIIDVYQDFKAAIEEQILVTPTLVIDQPKKAKILGNLQDKAKVRLTLGLV